MSKQIILTIVLFVVALGSGIVVGMNVKRGGDREGGERSFLADELKLTPTQRDQMREIWQEMAHGGARRDAYRTIQKERDEEVVALLTPDQKAAYDKIQEKATQKIAELNKERDAAFQKAVEKTKAILDPQQRVKYEEILKRGPGAGGPRGRREATQPATAPAAK